MRLASWNINSVRLRVKHIIDFIRKYEIDVICLQETKTQDIFFPEEEFLRFGWGYSYFRGEKSYNGVAIVSRIPIKTKSYLNWCGKLDTRHIFVVLENNLAIHNFYVPAGGDLPDIKKNIKFKQKIQFLKEMISYFKNDKKNSKILVGDLNIAPLEYDVWSHKQLLNIISHTPIETNLFKELLNSGDFIDIIRSKAGEKEKLYSWWSYRSKDWKKFNKGRRLDHILVSKKIKSSIISNHIYTELRSWKKPSDHVPVVTNLDC